MKSKEEIEKIRKEREQIVKPTIYDDIITPIHEKMKMKGVFGIKMKAKRSTG